MQLTVKGKQIDVGDALRQHVEDSVSSLTEKYFTQAIESTVIFSKDAYLYRAAVQIHAGRGIVLQATAEANEPYPAFDLAAERLAKRLRRYKSRLQDHHRRIEEAAAPVMAADYVLAAEKEDHDEESADTAEPMIVAEMQTKIEAMSVSEAVMRMELAELPALMFRNSSHDGLNMVYRREDGNVGWVDPVGNGS